MLRDGTYCFTGSRGRPSVLQIQRDDILLLAVLGSPRHTDSQVLGGLLSGISRTPLYIFKGSQFVGKFYFSSLFGGPSVVTQVLGAEKNSCGFLAGPGVTYSIHKQTCDSVFSIDFVDAPNCSP